jgi:hypothetical protein
MNQPPNVQVKIDDATLKGAYANMMQVAHTREEFVLDFMNVLPPAGIISSRVITSPGHFKRIVRALKENLERFEETYGQIQEAPAPERPFGFDSK